MRFLKQFKRSGWTALKISVGKISFVHVEQRGNDKPVVVMWEQQALELNDVAALKSWVHKNQLKGKPCIALLNRSEYRLIQTEAVEVPPAEIKQAVRWRIKEMLEYPAMQATIDVLNIPADSSNPSRQRYMLAIAVRNDIIRTRIVQFIDQAGTGLEAIDIPEMGQRNIATMLEQQNRALALLSFNEDGGLLTISAGGELFHSLHMSISAEQLQSEDEQRRTMLYERIALDLQRTLDNFERQFPYVTINKLFIAPFVMREGFFDFIRSYLYLPVECFQLSDLFDFSGVPKLSEEAEQARAFILLGTALRERT